MPNEKPAKLHYIRPLAAKPRSTRKTEEVCETHHTETKGKPLAFHVKKAGLLLNANTYQEITGLFEQHRSQPPGILMQ